MQPFLGGRATLRAMQFTGRSVSAARTRVAGKEAWEPCGGCRTRRHALRLPTTPPPPTLTQTRNGRLRRLPSPFSLLSSRYSFSSTPVVLVCVYFVYPFFPNLCRPPCSTSSRPKEQSLGSRSTAQGYPFSTSRRRSSSRTTLEKPTTLTSSFTIPPIRVRLSIRAASDHDALLPPLLSRVCNTCSY
jgi:hypothetical protein